MTLPRPLSANEEGVLRRLLMQEFPGADALRRQVDYVEATPGCGCGCGTIDLTLTADVARAEITVEFPLSAGFKDERGLEGGILLFLRDGVLSCLEVYGVEDVAMQIPDPRRLKMEPPRPA